MVMRRKYFFKAPFRSDAYISLRLESEKFTLSKDERHIVATEPLTLREYYAAFHVSIPFRAYIKDKVELVVPDDLNSMKTMARHVCYGVRKRFLSWWTIDRDDLDAVEEVEIRGDFHWLGVIAEMSVKGYAEVRTPYICDDPDDCMWPSSLLVQLYELANEYKVLEYRGASTISLVIKLFSKKAFSYISIRGADAGEVEQLLKKEGFTVLRSCNESKAELRIEKMSENKFYIECF